MKWFNKKTANNTDLKITTPTILDPMLQTSVQKRAYHTTKTQTAGAGGKTKKARVRRYKTIPQSVYDSAKKLLEINVPKAEIARILGISVSSVIKISQSKDWTSWEVMRSEMTAYRIANMEKASQRKQIEVKEEQELEQWQFIVGWSNDAQRLQANAVRDLAKALGLRVEE